MGGWSLDKSDGVCKFGSKEGEGGKGMGVNCVCGWSLDKSDGVCKFGF